MRSGWRIYAILVIARVLIAFTSRSIIHPDEHFQNPEVAARLIFDYAKTGAEPLETWEWRAEAPCRSVAPLLVSTAPAFYLVRAFFDPYPSATTLHLAQRAAMLLVSFVNDLCVYKASGSVFSLLFFASAPITSTFLVRPFSNSIECVALSLSLWFTSRILSNDTRYLVPLGIVMAFGVWTRVTFVAFAIPLVVAVIHQYARTMYRGVNSTLIVLARGSPACMSFAMTAYALSVLDTAYFQTERTLSDILRNPSALVFTPLNLLKYNLSSTNLAQHGLHPRYLHALVNLPMLFGIGIASVIGALKTQLRDGKYRKPLAWNRVLLSSFIVPLALLSIQPHQEPRFLVPLVVPLALLASGSPTSSIRSISNKRKRYFVSLWILHSVLFTAFFGYLHQGALLPTLFQLNRHLSDLNARHHGQPAEHLRIVFWKTFMPPRHLLVPLRCGRDCPDLGTISLFDLGGASVDSLQSTLLSTLETGNVTVPSMPKSTIRTLLVTPDYLFNPRELRTSPSGGSGPPAVCLTAGRIALTSEPGFEPIHLDMDRLGEMLDGVRETGWTALRLGVWEIMQC